MAIARRNLPRPLQCNRIHALSAIALIALAAFTAGLGAQQHGGLTGRVSDDAGHPLAGSNVELASPAFTTSAIADSAGRYDLGPVPPGVYALRVTHIGYAPRDIADVRVEPGAPAALDIALTPAAIPFEQSVVTASRRRERIRQAPASIAVVEAEEIRARPALNPAEHVRDLPGVDYAQTGLNQTHVAVRGFNRVFSGDLLTLTDHRIARVPSLRFNGYHFIPAANDDIDRVEVVLGPGSALYGPNSADGVLHILTRSPLESQGTTLRLGAGERAVRNLSLRHAGRVNTAFGYKLSAQYQEGDDWEHVEPGEIIARDFAVERKSAELRLDYRPDDDLQTTLTLGRSQALNIEMTGVGASQVDWTYSTVQARLVYRDLFAQVYRNWNDAGDSHLLTTGNPVVDRSSLTVFQLQHGLALGARHRLSYGADALLTRPDTEGTINGRNEATDDIDEIGAFAQSHSDLGEKLDLVMALRYDTHNRTSDAGFSPRLALVYDAGQAQTLRLTYNRAFSTPSNNNLFLDVVAAPDVLRLGAFGPSLGFDPSVDLRIQGTGRKGFDEGLTFPSAPDGRPLFRSSFAPLAGLAPEEFIALDDPLFTNVMWGISRGAVLAGVPPLLTAQLAAAGLDEAAAAAAAGQLAADVAAIVPQQLDGLKNSVAQLNLGTGRFDPVERPVDIARTKPTVTQTFEIGYKGVLGGKLVLAADAYHTKRSDFVSSVSLQTPSVFLQAESLGAALTPAIETALADDPELAQALGALDQAQIPGQLEGNNNGSAADELVGILAGGAARIPLGTVSPAEAYYPTALLMSYRNFGEVSFNGFDASLAYYPTEDLRLSANYSLISENLFENLEGIADVALNTPKHKLKLGANYALPRWDLQLGARARYSSAFDVENGVYVGKVDAFTVLDLNARYILPVDPALTLVVRIDNALDNAHREYVGAPEIGRLAQVQLGLSF